MANDSKKYVSLTRLSDFLDNIRAKYSQIGHKHTISDLTDYTVDDELSSTSANPVQNKVLDAEFNAVSQAMGALDLAIDGKADASHNHNDVYYTETEIDSKLETKSDKSHTHKVADITDLTATVTELNYMDGVTSNVQEQLDAKAASTHTHSNVSLGQGYGDCYTTGSTIEKAVDIYKYELKTGGVVSVKFIYSVPASATMNINSSGAKSIYYRGSAITSDIIKGNDTATFIYDGSRYHLISVDRWHKDIVDLQATDGQVSQRVVSANSNYPLLLAQNFQTEDYTGQVYFDSGVYLNPYYNRIYADISGTATGLSSTLDIAHGGTGATDVATARTNLGLDESILLKDVEIRLPYGKNWSDVAYGDGKFVAVADKSDIAVYSTNGVTWTETTMPVSLQWKSVVYGNGKFVAIAYDTNITAYSTDGITWTEATISSDSNWQTITFGNGIFVAAAFSSFRVAYSTDGITWTEMVMQSRSWYSSAYGNGTFVVISNGDSVASYSTDGITWEDTNMPASADWIDVTFGNGKFVAISSNNTMTAYSTDGINWTESLMPVSTAWARIAYGDGVFVAIANNSTRTAYSVDGINWTAGRMTLNNSWRCFTYGNGKFVAIPYGDTDATISTDGINWSTSAQILKDVNDTDITQTVKNALGISGASTSGADINNAILITVDDIDAICGATITYANPSEVTF